MKTTNTTLMLIIKKNKILLAQKKRDFGYGKFNGVGGKVENGETIMQAAIRETKEEIFIEPIDPILRGIIEFDEYYKGERTKVIMNIFVANSYYGRVRESDEMRPQWFNLHSIPYDNMFPDDRLWLPKVLNGEAFKEKFKFDENFNLISYSFKNMD